MPSLLFTNTIAAGATVANIVAGSAFEFLKNLSRIDIGQVTDNAAGQVLTTIQFGPEVQMEEAPVPAQPAAGRGPLIPDDIMVSDAGAPGDRLVIRTRNTAAGAAVVRTLVRIRPIG